MNLSIDYSVNFWRLSSPPSSKFNVAYDYLFALILASAALRGLVILELLADVTSEGCYDL